MSKYKEPGFYIETTHGCYSESGWCYSAYRKSLNEAIEHASKQPGQRVVDENENVLWTEDL